MLFKPSAGTEILDWITPPQVQVVRVETLVEPFERIQRRAQELREAMGPRYLCHEKNQVRRLDGRSYKPRKAGASNVRVMKHAA